MRYLSGPIGSDIRGNLAGFLLSTAHKSKNVSIDDDSRDAYNASQAAYGSQKHHDKLISRGYLKDELSTHNTHVYSRGDKALVGFRGTVNDKNDYNADLSIAAGLQNLNPEFHTAKAIGERVKQKYKGGVTYTGHSLGGTKAVETSRTHGGKSIVFNPGTGPIAPLDTNHSKVYRTRNDYISYNTSKAEAVFDGGHSLSNFEYHFS